MAVALAALGGLLAWGSQHFDWVALQATPLLRAGIVLGMVAGGALLYFAVLMALGLKPRQMLRPPKETPANA